MRTTSGHFLGSVLCFSMGNGLKTVFLWNGAIFKIYLLTNSSDLAKIKMDRGHDSSGAADT